MIFNPVLAGLTFRQALAKRRWLIVVLLAALPVVLAALTRFYATVDDEPLGMVAGGLSGLIFTVVVPIIALVLASSSFGAEIDDGTVIYLLAKPISRTEIVITKLVVTASICIVLGGLSTLGSGMIMMKGLDSTRLVLGFTVGAALGAFLYSAIFLALGLITKRGMLVGLVYLVIWEGTLGRFFKGTRVLSVRQYMLAVTDAIATVDKAVFEALLAPQTAYIMSAVVAAGAIALCIYRLRNFEIGQTG
jgi:ABC-2 type transport system permease protein